MTASKILDKAVRGDELTAGDAEALFTLDGEGLRNLTRAADEVRSRRCGERVTYVVNRNINFTNVCVKRCGFCAFSRGHRAEEGYFLPMEEVVRRAREAKELGATEICLQAGLPPRMKGSYYIDLCRAIKKELPGIHLHAFSPEETLYGASRSDWTVERYLAALKDAGLGSMPGTSAEILDDEVRERISPGRISTFDWLRVIRSAHKLGIRSSSTMMFGHVETPRHRAAHLALLRDTQKETGGFTEFVPLSFIHTEAPMFQKSLVAGILPGPSEEDVVRMYAISRLMLQGWIDNVQASWVKQGPQFAARCLQAGANDFGGTLINESISTAAGAPHGQFLRPSEIRNRIRGAGRIPAERSTVYGIRRVFDIEPGEPDPLDLVAKAFPFGSYRELTASSVFRFRDRSRDQVEDQCG
ncbi:MAG TPA: 5-amino-6-(D-ribitylamino)uracil--L-tyrosine 4-hydroxyphenyl transferase CofH [Bryobacteraceae bacterium]|nr:5-amino-6-(D-ribitylamino)uracil--L-tyrosine 4-hydroxyphenyl transferase CofH [Bryobacteraceae bacterium]